MKQDSSSSPASTGGEPRRPPPTVPDYEILRPIGGGAYGEVWLARDIMGLFRAVKVVDRADFREDRPFDREFEGILAFQKKSPSHPSQVNIFHVGRNAEAGYFYCVMELADDQRTGQQIDPDRYEPKTLRSELKQQGRLLVAKCLKIGVELASALAHLHKHELVHRDIKPSNIIFVNAVPKLADIGLVTAASKESSLLGTSAYVAPEGSGEKQADIYGLGLVLYEMITGFSARQYPKVPDEWAASPDRDVHELNQVVNRACEHNVERRYKTAEEMCSALALLANKPLRKAERALQRVRLILGMLLVGGIIFGFFSLKNRAAEQNRRRELREIQISRMQVRRAGWFSNNWSRLKHAAASRNDQEVQEQASALLAGLDARPVKVLEGVAAASAAFGLDGRALVGGAGPNGLAMLIGTNGALRELPVRGEGPVCWTPDGVPLQFVVATNALVLREAHTGNVRREFPLGGMEASPPGSPPILAVTPEGSRVAAGLGGRVFVWKAASGSCWGKSRRTPRHWRSAPMALSWGRAARMELPASMPFRAWRRSRCCRQPCAGTQSSAWLLRVIASCVMAPRGEPTPGSWPSAIREPGS
jgi:serine/threonine protein kinase